MAKNVLITLTTAGTNVGPFNLYSDVDGFVTPFEIGISTASLVAGYNSSLVPNAATVIRVKSNGTCLNSIDLTITGTTTTSLTTTTSTSTTSTTSTTTSAPLSLNICIQNTTGVSIANFTAFLTVGGSTPNVINLTNITLPSSPNSCGYTLAAVVGSNTITLTANFISHTLSINDVRDATTGTSLSYSSSGGGTHTVTISSLVLTSGNITNGILIIVY